MNPYFSSVQAFIESEMKHGAFPGSLLLVHHHGKSVFEFHAGTYQNRERHDNALFLDTVHMLFSFSKGISATVVAMAQDRGLLDYDKPLSVYIPELKNTVGTKGTIRHCLTHSLGLSGTHIPAVDTPEGWRKGIDICAKASLDWEPGSKTHYHSTQGLFLAAVAALNVSGEHSWEALCQKWLFRPLGAASLTFDVPDRRDVALTPQTASSPCEITNTQWELLGHPGGGCFGEIRDAIKILDLHLADGQWQGKTILSTAGCREMHRIQYEKQMLEREEAGQGPVHEPWGLGWLIRRTMSGNWFGYGSVASRSSFGHAGIDTVQGIADPEGQVSFLFMTTNSPKPSGENTVRIRDAVATRVLEAMDRGALKSPRLTPEKTQV